MARERGHPTLIDTLQQAVGHVHETEGLKAIPGGWAWVKGRLEAMRDAAVAARMGSGPAGLTPGYNLRAQSGNTPTSAHGGRPAGSDPSLPNPAPGAIPRSDFEAQCAHPDCIAAGGVEEPAVLLDYLHQVGTVFHRSGLFRDRIVIDQQWALEAIYAVFERGSGAYTHIRERRGGRFTRAELAALLWDKAGHGEAEQALFLDMMRSCRIAFQLRAPEGSEPEYLAPDLLPPRAAVQDRLDDVWDDGAPTERAAFPYALLPPGLLRSLMAEVGELAGISAVYWDDGFYFYDAGTRARAMVEQLREDKGYAGRIELRTQARGSGGDASGLLAALAHIVKTHQDQLGVSHRYSEVAREGGFVGFIKKLAGRGESEAAIQLRDDIERSRTLLKDFDPARSSEGMLRAAALYMRR